MLKLAYTITPELHETLSHIDVLRVKIALALVPPKVEMKMQWEAQVLRIYNALLLSGYEVTKSELVKILSRAGNMQPKRQMGEKERVVMNYKRAMELLVSDWLYSQKSATAHLILNLAEVLYDGFRLHNLMSVYHVIDTPLAQLLDYLQSQNDHPVVQAGIIYSQFILLSPFGEKTTWMARILAYLFLYKNGFDARRLLVLENYWYTTAADYHSSFSTIRRVNSSTSWLSYFARGVEEGFGQITKNLERGTTGVNVPASFFQLSERQKLILDLANRPDERVTNRKVQKMCSVSQITASRDLSSLATLGLLYSHGKGRSVYYTRV